MGTTWTWACGTSHPATSSPTRLGAVALSTEADTTRTVRITARYSSSLSRKRFGSWRFGTTRTWPGLIGWGWGRGKAVGSWKIRGEGTSPRTNRQKMQSSMPLHLGRVLDLDSRRRYGTEAN